MELELRNLIYTYEPTEVNYYQNEMEVDDDEDEPWYEDVASKTFVDKINNNKIIFSFCSLNGKEEIPEDFVASVCNGITNLPYEYLMNVLNHNKNVKVEWSQVEGTTSDYSIYYDDIKTDRIDDCCGYKYTECENGKWSKIKFN